MVSKRHMKEASKYLASDPGGDPGREECKYCHLEAKCAADDLSVEQSDLIAQSITCLQPLRQGESIFRQGDSLKALYIVRTGTAKSFITTSNGQEQIIGFHFAGEILGLDAFENLCYNSSAEALEPLSLCRFTPESFDMLSQICPNFHAHCLTMIGREMTSIHEMVRVIGQNGIEEKLASFLLGISIRMKERGYSETKFDLSMSRNDIANFLGVASETVSREFTQLQKEGVLHVDRRRVCIESLESLEALTE